MEEGYAGQTDEEWPKTGGEQSMRQATETLGWCALSLPDHTLSEVAPLITSFIIFFRHLPD